MKMLLGIVLGGLVGWLYGSERAREEAQRRLSAAPASLHQVRQSVASAAAGGAQRVGGAIDAAPLPPQVKDAASRATSTVQTAAENVGQPRPETGPAGAEGAQSSL